MMSAALASTEDKPNGLAPLAGPHRIAPRVPAESSVRQAPEALAQENQSLEEGESPPVPWTKFESSGSVSTAVVLDADAAIMTAALFSMQNRQRQLTSLLHHLTVDPGAPDQELWMARPLPAPRVGEVPQIRRDDDTSVGFSSGRAELKNRLARNHDLVPPAHSTRT
jgi:hypothetical protein